jgi:hypothetical protein
MFTARLGHQVDSGGSNFGTKGPTHPTFKRRVRTRVPKLKMTLAKFPGPLAQFEELTCKPKWFFNLLKSWGIDFNNCGTT